MKLPSLRHLFFVAAVTLLPHFMIAAPAIVRSIAIAGNSVFTSREILGFMSLRPGQVFMEASLADDRRAIDDRYRKRGYLSSGVESVGKEYSSDSALVDLGLLIREGGETLVGGFALRGMHQFSESEVLSLFDQKVGAPLDEALLEQDIDVLLSAYDKVGYPFAQCRIAGITKRPGEPADRLDITLDIDEGQRVTIDEIRVDGNKETRPDVVVRETRLSFGEVFNPAKVDAIGQRLRRLNIFSEVSEPQLYLRKDRGGLLIRVREGNTNTFDGVIGYIPESATGQGGYLTGLASILMRNLFGTGRKLSFRWQREDRFSQELGFRYVEPWILGFPANLGGGFFQRQQDSSYVRRIVDVKAELMLSEELSVSALFGSESVIPSADSTLNRVLRSSTTTVGIELQYDTRDDIISPTSGALYRTDYQYGRKRISNVPSGYVSKVAGSSTVQRVTLDLAFYLLTFTQQVLAVGVHGREIQGGEIEEADMFRFGGMRTMRGYRENQFLGSRLAWSNTEYRLLLARRSFVYGFFDSGYYLRRADDVRRVPLSDAFKVGYGVGVQVETGLGTLGVSFALGQGDSFGQGKIHFGLINEF